MVCSRARFNPYLWTVNIHAGIFAGKNKFSVQDTFLSVWILHHFAEIFLFIINPAMLYIYTTIHKKALRKYLFGNCVGCYYDFQSSAAIQTKAWSRRKPQRVGIGCFWGATVEKQDYYLLSARQLISSRGI